jgi:hypothetical protein
MQNVMENVVRTMDATATAIRTGSVTASAFRMHNVAANGVRTTRATVYLADEECLATTLQDAECDGKCRPVN